MASTLAYVMEFVGDMDHAAAFYRDTLGLSLKFSSPDWTEFATGETTLVLHSATPQHPAGTFRLGFHVADLQAFYTEMTGKGVTFIMPPTPQFGTTVAQLLDSEGAECSVGAD
jgi:lactoylglutathione lyase